MLAKEGILYPWQASDIIGLTLPIKITKGGQIGVTYIISDGPTKQNIASSFNVVNDGDQVSTVASTINGTSVRLKANDGDQYADNSYTDNDVARNLDTLYPNANIANLGMQHKKIAPYTSAAADTFQATITKDGQTATTNLVLVYKSQPAAHNIKALSSTSSDLRIIANFSPLVAKDFLQYTQKSEAFDDPYKYIWYLFDLLNNGAWTEGGGVFPDVPDVGFDDPLASLMAGFGDPSQSKDRIIEELALNLDPGESFDFYQDLYGWFEYNETISPYMPANPGSYPSIEFDLHYQDAATYYISSYSFW